MSDKIGKDKVRSKIITEQSHKETLRCSSQCTFHFLGEAVDIIGLIEVSHSICPDPREFLFVTIAVHTRIVDWIPLVT